MRRPALARTLLVVRATRFTTPDSVDAWDHWVRWREAGCLRDRTIDDTWARVAQAIAPADDGEGRAWRRRYVDAFSRWELLPDERLLRLAGTGSPSLALDAPCAVLNVASFVIAPRSRQARFDDERFAGIAALAARLLDDALASCPPRTDGAAELHIGLVGFADALRLLDIAYDDPRAPDVAGVVGTALASGTLQGACELTAERGAREAAPASLLAAWRDRRAPGHLVEQASRIGVRHRRLTAIAPRPRLALLANAASDALDPRPADLAAARSADGPLRAAAADDARAAIHASIQPWIDLPIPACGSEGLATARA